MLTTYVDHDVDHDVDWSCLPCASQDRAHGASLRWLIMVEDSETDKVYHSELWTLTKRMAAEDKAHIVAFTIPIHHPLPTQHYIRYAARRKGTATASLCAHC